MTREKRYQVFQFACVSFDEGKASPHDKPIINRESLLLAKDIVIINLIMMAYEPKLSRIFAREFEYNPIMEVNSEAPDIMSFGMKFFSSQDGIKRVFPE